MIAECQTLDTFCHFVIHVTDLRTSVNKRDTKLKLEFVACCIMKCSIPGFTQRDTRHADIHTIPHKRICHLWYHVIQWPGTIIYAKRYTANRHPHNTHICRLWYHVIQWPGIITYAKPHTSQRHPVSTINVRIRIL